MTSSSPGPTATQHPLNLAYSVVERLRQRMRSAVRGRDAVIDLLIIALLADGHVLLEDFPGSGKTTLAKTLGESIEGQSAESEIAAFRRVQFTPDLLPSDVTGTTIFDPTHNQFFFRPGPVFAYVLLADEINRTSPKVQSALLEAMAEKQVTVDNQTRRLDDLFFVVATQNPLDLAGTFPLPNAQLDRFLFKVRMTHIDAASELAVLESLQERRKGVPTQLPRVSRDEVLAARTAVDTNIHVAPAIRQCLVDMAAKTRADKRILLGASTRSLVLAIPALQARALTQRRDYVSSDDLQKLSPLLFGHRLELTAGGEAMDAILQELFVEPLEKLSRSTLR